MKNQKRLRLTFVYILLIVLSIIWLFPIVWVVLTSFRGEGTAYVNYFIPKLGRWIIISNYSHQMPFLWTMVLKYIASCNSILYHSNLYHGCYGLLTQSYQI